MSALSAAAEMLDAARFYVANCPQRSRHDANGAGLNICDGPMCRRFRAAISAAEAGHNEIRTAIRLAGSASFGCGEWDPDDSDESFSDVLARSLAADRYLFALLGIPEDAQGATTVHSPADLVRQARAHLRFAREALKAAGAPRAAERVRAAIRSADGAQRHADAAPYREARQAVSTADRIR